MKTFFNIIAATLAVASYGAAINTYPQTNAAANVQFVGMVTNSDGTFTTVRVPSGSVGGGVTTNVCTDPLAIAFCASNKITSPYVQGRVQAHVQGLRLMSVMPVREFIFNPAYNPTNHLDLFGKAGNFVGESYDQFGFSENLTNYFYADLDAGGYTNWTVIIFKKSNFDLVGQDISHSIQIPLAWSMEGLNNGVFQSSRADFTSQIISVTNVFGALPLQTNYGSLSFLCYPGSFSAQNYLPSSYPSVQAFASDGAGSLIGWVDTMRIFANNNTANANLNCDNGGGYQYVQTNSAPATRLYLGGGSTNWFSISPLVAAGTPASNNRWATNGVDADFSVAIFNQVLSQADIEKYYTAVNELLIDRTAYIWFGDSMISEGSSRMILPQLGGTSYPVPIRTNNIPCAVATKHPLSLFKNYAMGGTWYNTFTNTSVVGGSGIYPTKPVLLLPTDMKVIINADPPRNDSFGTNYPVGYLGTLATNWASTFKNYMANGATFVSIESPQFASNTLSQTTCPAFGNVSVPMTNPLLRSNFVYAQYYFRTNWAWFNLVSKTVHISSVFNGSVLDTNNAYFLPDNGAHVENTNCPIYYRKVAALYDTGEWPDVMPTVPWLPSIPTVTVNVATSASGTGATATLDSTSTDSVGTITLNTGTVVTGGSTLLTNTFSVVFPAVPHITLAANNAASAGLSGLTMVYPSVNQTNMVISVGTTGLASSTTYIWTYLVK